MPAHDEPQPIRITPLHPVIGARVEGLQLSGDLPPATVTAIRAGDKAAASRPPSASAVALDPGGALAELREAIDAGAAVVIGYVDNHGTRADRVVRPLSVEGGQLRAHDVRADDERLFAVHRISSVRPV